MGVTTSRSLKRERRAIITTAYISVEEGQRAGRGTQKEHKGKQKVVLLVRENVRGRRKLSLIERFVQLKRDSKLPRQNPFPAKFFKLCLKRAYSDKFSVFFWKNLEGIFSGKIFVS
jgi:hypothetical protein